MLNFLCDLLVFNLMVISLNGYFLVDTDIPGNDAQAYCNALGRTLATITNSNENDEVSALCATSTTNSDVLCTIGLNDRETEGTFEFEDGTSVSFTNWNTLGYAQNNAGGRDCVVISGKGKSWIENKSWQVSDCVNAPRPFICNGNGNSGVREYFLIDNPIPGNNAKEYCESMGTTLATITSSAENSIVQNLCATSTSQSGNVCTIGISDANTEGTPEWHDGSPIIYENWNPQTVGYGDNNHNQHDTAVIAGSQKSWINIGTWQYSNGVSVDRPFICNGDGKRTYYAVNNEVNADTAESKCQLKGSNLATITSASENNDVASICSGSITGDTVCWIGLHDSNIEGTFEWTDGITPYGYSNFASDPKQSSSRDCGAIAGSNGAFGSDYGEWKIKPCAGTSDGNTKAFICNGKMNVLSSNSSSSRTFVNHYYDIIKIPKYYVYTGVVILTLILLLNIIYCFCALSKTNNIKYKTVSFQSEDRK
eukprot:237395_1